MLAGIICRIYETYTLLSIHQFTADNVFTFEMLMPPAHVFTVVKFVMNFSWWQSRTQ